MEGALHSELVREARHHAGGRVRNYRLREGATRELIHRFEQHFLLSQRAEGMYPLGQVEVVDEPDRWQARRSEANAMLLDDSSPAHRQVP